MTPSPENIELYTQGSCHVFAAACLLEHAGEFLVASDYGSAHFETDDGDVNEVIHVFARHILPDGRVIVRDILGDRVFENGDYKSALREELSARYGVWETDIGLEVQSRDDMHELIDDTDREFGRIMGSTDECAVIEDPEGRPLHAVTLADIEEARALEECRAEPGKRPAPEPPKRDEPEESPGV